MNKTKLRPFQVWWNSRRQKYAVVVESLGVFMDAMGGGSDAARVMVMDTMRLGMNDDWRRATWRNGAPKGWELVRP